jgi:hypothetical protein
VLLGTEKNPRSESETFLSHAGGVRGTRAKTCEPMNGRIDRNLFIYFLSA